MLEQVKVTIQEASELKLELERDILKLITGFTEKTGVFITSVNLDIDYIQRFGFKPERVLNRVFVSTEI